MSLGTGDIRAIASLMRAVAGAEIMPRFGRIGPADQRTKSGPLDPVTVADEAAEHALIEGLARLFPGAAIIGEESVSADPALIGRLAEQKPVFVIDPIDGTQNYAAGLPLFGVMIALVENGEITAGLIHDPLRDDTAYARAGYGAFLLRADGSEEALHVADAVPLERMIASVSWQYMKEPARSRVLNNLLCLGQVPNLRCAAATYRAIAMGHIHATLLHRTLPWDHAPGVLIVSEAGGYVRKPDGGVWHPSELESGLLAASD
ncbi:MAG TPA: inositol monophosphatase family protein, partial [Acidiphilium sp.]